MSDDQHHHQKPKPAAPAISEIVAATQVIAAAYRHVRGGYSAVTSLLAELGCSLVLSSDDGAFIVGVAQSIIEAEDTDRRQADDSWNRMVERNREQDRKYAEWLSNRCPRCEAPAGSSCVTPSGRQVTRSNTHVARTKLPRLRAIEGGESS